MIKYKLKATIPTVQYGNLMPEIELEGDDLETLHKTAEDHIKKVWDKYGERPLKENKNTTDGAKELDTFTGEKVLFDELSHKYFSLDGKPLLSGSAYAASLSPKFDKAMLLPKTATAWGVEEKSLDDVWNLNALVSTSYGNTIHTALELWHKYYDVGARVAEKKGLSANYVMPKSDWLSKIVQEFDDKFGHSAIVEVLVSDTVNGMAGQIDRLNILDTEKKVCRIGDYKTNFELDKKKIAQYQLQLSFYAKILQNKGWTVEGLDLYHYSGEWTLHQLDILPVEMV